MNNRILVIEDDPDINGLLRRILERARYEVETAFSGTEGALLVDLREYDLVLMDLMLPGMSGEELLMRIRAEERRMPVIALSAKAGLEDKVKVLESGADDYMTKPFEKQELLARVQAQLRRAGTYSAPGDGKGEKEEKLSAGELEVYPQSRRVILGGKEISLTRYEFRILEVLMACPAKVFSKEGLYQAVWENGFYGEDNAVSVHVSNIRKKLSAVSDREYIRTVWGIGYKFEAE